MNSSYYGLYIHVPFCKRKCQYCDFVSYTNLEKFEKPYVDALCREIQSFASQTVDSVYFGGGTPSLLSEQSVAQIMATLHQSFVITQDAEITIEVNPASVTKGKLLFYRQAGINRLSIGVQSTQENELQYLGRLHSAADAEQTVRWAQEVGFSNMSVDLMYGFLPQTMDSLYRTLQTMVSWPIRHISCYGLRIEPDTPFGVREKKGECITQSDDAYADMYQFIVDFLAKQGFVRYEISNFAQNDYAARHNKKYWQHVPYIGFGAAAHSYYQHTRYQNAESLADYIKNPMAYRAVIPLSFREEREEYIVTALRLEDGFSLQEYSQEFGSDFLKDYAPVIAKHEKMHLLKIQNGRCRLTDKAFYISNAILCDFID